MTLWDGAGTSEVDKVVGSEKDCGKRKEVWADVVEEWEGGSRIESGKKQKCEKINGNR